MLSPEIPGFFYEELLITALIQKNATVNVKAGENRGVKLSHTNIVRS
ncbi:MAG: hypothetical protein H7Y01_13865 [Ferruginibacter sp.]|nr:hypothetical protein [Chitinophagaceae bacterium]